LVLLGQVNVAGFTTNDWLRLMFPVHMKHYWFVTSYVILMLFVPILNIAIKQMNRVQHLTCTVLFVLYQTLPKSVLPLVFTDDDAGYGPIWLICLYLIAAYIRKYGISFFNSAKKSFLCYIGGTLVIWASILGMQEVYFALYAFGERINFALHYNHVFCLFTSVALFYVFVHWTPKESKLTEFAVKIGGYTFGVYLLHEHMLVGYNWTKWLQVMPADSVLWTVFTMIWKCALVLVVGIFIDWLRSLVFRGIGKVIMYTPVPKLINKLDQCMRGEA
jgi:surface polysaccharide O-acyltransferase-like enzyme